MPSAPLTDTEIDRLRRYISECKIRGEYPAETGNPHPPRWLEEFARLYFNALPRLLDEVEKTRAGAVVIRLEEDGKSVPFSEALIEVVGKYRTLLKRIEWNGPYVEPKCPACERTREAGHADACELAAYVEGVPDTD